MPRIVPTEVVETIDKWFPWASDAKTARGNQRTEARFIGVNLLPGLVEMIDQIADELLALEPAEASIYLMARAALKREGQILASGARKDAVEWPMLGDRDCVEIVRTILVKCGDEPRSASAVELKFLKDPDLQATLQTDIGSVERALANGEWKAATVIGGSLIEALLLWVVDSHDQPEISVAVRALLSTKKLKKAPEPEHDQWRLFELIEVAHQLIEISDDTLSSVDPSRNFRNAIHPGRVQRTGIRCDRGAAYTTYGALFNVIRELTANHP